MTVNERAATQPRYHEVASELRRRIADGSVELGASLPSEHALAEHFGVSRDTVRKALERLQLRGIVDARHGVGWMVQSSLHTQPFGVLRSFAQWAEDRGLAPGGRRIFQERSVASASEARALHLPLGSEVLRVTRMRTLDDRPVMLERTTYTAWVADVIERLPPDASSVVAALEDVGITVQFGKHHIDAVSASSDDARLLRIRRSSPLLRIERETFGHDGRAIEHGEDRYLPDTIKFEVDSSATNAKVGHHFL